MRQTLRDSGRVEGENIAFEFRWANGRTDLLPDLVHDLVQRKVAVIVALGGNAPALAAKAATATIPIVFNTGADPVRSGLVSSLNRPGGNVTGISFLVEQVTSKLLGLLHELLPHATTFGLLVNSTNPNVQRDCRYSSRGKVSCVQIQVVKIGQPRELEGAFTSLAGQRVSGLVVGADPLFTDVAAQIIDLAAKYRIPTAYWRRRSPEAGGLMSYGTSATEAYSRVGAYVARIMDGAKPGDLPVFEVVQFEFVLNLKAAEALDLSVPSSMVFRADEVIE
jgi:ABC-type uncharacterized transport system substrate-binding protein